MLTCAIVAAGLTPAAAVQQGAALSGVAQGADKAPLPNHTVQLRNASTGQLVGTTASSQAGEFSFAGLQPGTYIVEIVDAAGRLVGLSPSIPLAANAIVTVTVSASAAGALAASAGAGFSLFGLGPLASIAVVGAAVATSVTAVVATRDGKIVVCHQQPGASPQTLEINEAVLESHMAHGDTLGACPASPSR
jgi:carboxypeptidase family protein